MPGKILRIPRVALTHRLHQRVQLVRRNDEELLEIVDAIIDHPVDLSADAIDDEVVLSIRAQSEADCVP